MANGNNKLMFIIIIALLVVLIGAIGVAAFLILRSNNNNAGEESEGTVVASEDVRLTPKDITIVNLNEAISTNLLKGTDSKDHVIRLSVGVGVVNTDKKVSEELIALMTEKEVIWRDVVLGLVRDKTKEEMEKVDGRDTLKEEVKTTLQSLYDTNLIVEVYVSDIFIQ